MTRNSVCDAGNRRPNFLFHHHPDDCSNKTCCSCSILRVSCCNCDGLFFRRRHHHRGPPSFAYFPRGQYQSDGPTTTLGTGWSVIITFFRTELVLDLFKFIHAAPCSSSRGPNSSSGSEVVLLRGVIFYLCAQSRHRNLSTEHGLLHK